MDFLTQDELKTHLYEEIANEITRDDDGIIQDAIDTALAEAMGYLSKYDVALILAPVALVNRNKKLLSIVKDIASWHLLRLANPNIELALHRVNYDYAIDWLQRVQKGTIVPDLPLPTTETDPEGTTGESDGNVKWKSNNKRNNHF